MINRSGSVKSISLITVSVVSIVIVVVLWRNSTEGANPLSSNDLMFEVVRGPFESTIIEPGDLESSSNVEIRCEVKSNNGGSGTAILNIVEEGTYVREGDSLVQFDDSSWQRELTTQKIRVANDRAMQIQAESDLEQAKLILKEFDEGTYKKDKEAIEARQGFAKENAKRAEEFFKHSQKLFSRGYLTETQLYANRFAAERALKELDLVTTELKVFTAFTHDRLQAQYKSAIEKLTAQAEAAGYTFNLSDDRLTEIQEQLDKCEIFAPTSGMVTYANDRARQGYGVPHIEEGAVVRKRQMLIRLPDPKRMQVTTKVNDSTINHVKKGNPVNIILDADPENPIEGIVEEVSNFPLPRRWAQAPIEYEVIVRVKNVTEAVRPGLRAKAEIFVEKIDDAIQAPVSALLLVGDQHYVTVESAGVLRPQPVTIGPHNEKTVVIIEGLQPGDNVVVDGEKYRDQFDLKAQSGS